MVKCLCLAIRSSEVTGITGVETLSVIRRADLEKDFVGECLWLELLLPKAKGILFGNFFIDIRHNLIF